MGCMCSGGWGRVVSVSIRAAAADSHMVVGGVGRGGGGGFSWGGAVGFEFGGGGG